MPAANCETLPRLAKSSGRASIYMAVDVYSRRAIVLVTPTPRAAGVGELMRKSIDKWGVPERIHTDNGSDFTARWTRRLFDHFGTKIELSKPYEPRSKGIVERTIGTKPGTGGSSGVGFLRAALDLTFFPELYAVRTEVGR